LTAEGKTSEYGRRAKYYSLTRPGRRPLAKEADNTCRLSNATWRLIHRGAKRRLDMRPEHWLYTIPLRLRSLFRWAQADREVDDELRDHLDVKTEQYVAQGMTQEEAHRRARLDLGGIVQTKEKCRDARRVNWIQDFVQDL